jgi:pyruvate formate lyase activating enzyme
MYDMAVRAREDGIKSVVITGGFIEKDPLDQLLNVVDAIKVDLKAIRQEYYRDVVRGDLQPVLDRLVQIKKSGVWLEIVYLIVPTLNDTDAEFGELARWIRTNLGSDTPVHFSRFHPQYLLTGLPPTPLPTMDRAYKIARAEGLDFVYLGNVPGHAAESTYCPGCGKIVIGRKGYQVDTANLVGGACRSCGQNLPGRF